MYDLHEDWLISVFFFGFATHIVGWFSMLWVVFTWLVPETAGLLGILSATGLWLLICLPWGLHGVAYEYSLAAKATDTATQIVYNSDAASTAFWLGALSWGGVLICQALRITGLGLWSLGTKIHPGIPSPPGHPASAHTQSLEDNCQMAGSSQTHFATSTHQSDCSYWLC